jgi:hypothetical protein
VRLNFGEDLAAIPSLEEINAATKNSSVSPVAQATTRS